MTRRIIVPVDDLLRMLVDYTKGEGSIPYDAVPISLQVNPTQQGMFGLVVESAEFKDDTPIPVHFDIKRVYSAGGNVAETN